MTGTRASDFAAPVIDAPPSGDAVPAEAVLAIDLGGTKITGALVARDGSVGPVTRVDSPAAIGPDAVVDALESLMGRVRTVGWPSPIDGSPGSPHVRAVGVGTAGVVDVTTGTIVSATDTFKDWPGTPLGARLGAATERIWGTPVPVHVQNDVDAHAEGEVWHGAAAGARSCLVVAVGTGVGAGLVLDGHVLRGAHHVAGEIGHVPIGGADHLLCPCGRPGHLEAIGSGAGMLRHFAWLGGREARSGRDVVALARAGDKIARRAVRESAAAVGRGIAAVVTVFDPELVVVTGGVVGAGSVWWSPMEQALRGEVVDVLADLPVVAGSLGERGPLLGAAHAALRQIGAA